MSVDLIALLGRECRHNCVTLWWGVIVIVDLIALLGRECRHNCYSVVMIGHECSPDCVTGAREST